jgi:hypothetical protein
VASGIAGRYTDAGFVSLRPAAEKQVEFFSISSGVSLFREKFGGTESCLLVLIERPAFRVF